MQASTLLLNVFVQRIEADETASIFVLKKGLFVINIQFTVKNSYYLKTDGVLTSWTVKDINR